MLKKLEMPPISIILFNTAVLESSLHVQDSFQCSRCGTNYSSTAFNEDSKVVFISKELYIEYSSYLALKSVSHELGLIFFADRTKMHPFPCFFVSFCLKTFYLIIDVLVLVCSVH